MVPTWAVPGLLIVTISDSFEYGDSSKYDFYKPLQI